MVDKIRPNIWYLGLIVGLLIFGLAMLCVNIIYRGALPLPGEAVLVALAVLGTLVSVGVGGLLAVMAAVAQDPPPPTVPADTHERSLAAVLDIGCENADCPNKGA